MDRLTFQDQDVEEQQLFRFVIRDRDVQFTTRFATIFGADGAEPIWTPYRDPKTNAFGERWSRTARVEWLDRRLIRNEAPVRGVMKGDLADYNHARPHQGIAQRCPIPRESRRRKGSIKRRAGLGGSIHDDYRAAA